MTNELHFFEKVKKICQKQKKVLQFIDMDGTIAEYEFFTKEFKELNADGLFINIRPLTTVINCIEKINQLPNVETYILSICMFEDDKRQKLDWLERHTPFIKKENRIILTKENGDYNDENMTEVKAKFIDSHLKENEHAILLEDTHDNMKKAKAVLDDRITNFHISSFIL